MAIFKIDSKELLREALINVAKRPSLYVGTERLDYLEKFFTGWRLVATPYPWADDNEIQEWIFLKESVSIARAASLHGRSLISLCYGNRAEAITQFRTMLEEVKFRCYDDMNGEHTVSTQIYGVKSLFESIFEGEDYFFPHTGKSLEALKLDANKLVGEVKKTYESIIPIISRIVNEPHDDLWVYVHYETYFLSVRFLYRTDKGEWKENTTLFDSKNYFSNLLILHAYVAFVQKKEHENHVVTLRHYKGFTTVDYKEVVGVGVTWHEISSARHKKTFCKLYEKWKEEIML